MSVFIVCCFLFIKVLVQHDEIKFEILKQNALSLLIDNYEHFNYRTKRLVLEFLLSITFVEEAASLLRENKRFVNSMEHIEHTTQNGIKKAAEKILWNLKKGN